MNIIYLLIGCSILIAAIFLGAFFWASTTGQHDDTDTPAMRMLFDEEGTSVQEPLKETKSKK